MKLSSHTTFFWKFIFTGIWIVAVLGGIGYGFWHWIVLSEPILQDRTLSAILFYGAGVAFTWWFLGPLKSVYLEGEFLAVSNYFRKIRIPLSAIRYVDDPENSSHRRVFVSFYSPTEFGDEIVFIPPFFKAQSTTEQLRRQIDRLK